MKTWRDWLARSWEWLLAIVATLALVAVAFRRTPTRPSAGGPTPPATPPAGVSLPPVPVVKPRPSAPIVKPLPDPVSVPERKPEPAPIVAPDPPSLPAPEIISGKVLQSHCESAVKGLDVDWRWAMALALMESSGDGMVGREALTRTEVHVFKRHLPKELHAKAGDLIERGVRGRTNVEVHAWSRSWLKLAAEIDREAAFKSCSYGAWQIMGFNFKTCGFASAQGLAETFDRGIDKQALGLRSFLEASPSIVQAMKRLDFAAVGVAYNGPGEGNRIDGKPNPNSRYNSKLRERLVDLGVMNV